MCLMSFCNRSFRLHIIYLFFQTKVTNICSMTTCENVVYFKKLDFKLEPHLFIRMHFNFFSYPLHKLKAVNVPYLCYLSFYYHYH